MFELIIANKNYSSWSLRPWVLMRELAIPFREIMAPFGAEPGYPTIAEVSPSGRVPCLRHGDLRVWDSLAIVEYLAEAFPAVWPTDRVARAFARSAAAEMHSGFAALREQCSMNCGARIRLHRIDNALKRDLDRLDVLWNEGLRSFGGPYLAGSRFSAVDAFFAPVAFRKQSYGFELPVAANRYGERLLELPAMQSWYAEALKETWIDADHDEEVSRFGSWLQDLRESR
ncbi:MAG: glutathione S-transferase family protein [Steroidobacteraceae bacterium]